LIRSPGIVLNGVDELGFLLDQDDAIALTESTHTSRVMHALTIALLPGDGIGRR